MMVAGSNILIWQHVNISFISYTQKVKFWSDRIVKFIFTTYKIDIYDCESLISLQCIDTADNIS